MSASSIKVLHVLTVPYGGNGVTRCAMNYITHLTDTRADIACGFPLPAAASADFAARGARAVSLPPRLRRPLAYGRALARLIREEGYGLVHVHGNSCTMALELLAAKAGGAAARVPHAHNTRCSAKLLHRLLRPAFDRLRSAAFACGQAAGEFLYEGQPFTIVKNAIDTAAFAFDSAARERVRADLGLEGRFVLGHVGGFNTQKNHAFLLDIFRALREKLPGSALMMVGDGPLRESIERAAADAGLWEDIRIVRSSGDMASLYAAMDLFALPSLFEGLPFTLIEAQANGLPCFASDAVTREAAVSALVRFLPPEASAETWAAAIADSPRENRATASMEAAARIAESGYSIVQEAAALEALYRRLIGGGRA